MQLFPFQQTHTHKQHWCFCLCCCLCNVLLHFTERRLQHVIWRNEETNCHSVDALYSRATWMSQVAKVNAFTHTRGNEGWISFVCLWVRLELNDKEKWSNNSSMICAFASVNLFAASSPDTGYNQWKMCPFIQPLCVFSFFTRSRKTLKSQIWKEIPWVNLLLVPVQL